MNTPFIDYLKSLPSCVIYINNNEYRNAMRRVFQMNTETITPYAELESSQIDMENIDDESKDEMQYDMKSMDIHLNELYELTKSEPKFRELYEKAAGRMFSEDPLIGQVVLCSYDFFNLYYSCVWFYLHGGHTGLISCAEYIRLAELLK